MNFERLREVAKFAQDHAEQITDMAQWEGCPWGMLAKAEKYGLTWEQAPHPDDEGIYSTVFRDGDVTLRGWNAVAEVLDARRWEASYLFGSTLAGKEAADEITRRVERSILDDAEERGVVDE